MGLRLLLRCAAVWSWLTGGSGHPPRRSLVLDLHISSKNGEEAGQRHEAEESATIGRHLRGRRLTFDTVHIHGAAKDSYPCELGNYDNVQYHLIISVGSPCDNPAAEGQVFHVVPDTGSSDLWVPASNCSQCRGTVARFDPKQSCTAKLQGQRITFKYGDGTTAQGVSLLDTVKVGGLKVENQFLIQVDTMEATTHMQSDGILGLAHRYNRDEKGEKGHTFLSTVFREHPEMPKMFSMYLTGKAEKPSQLVFGDPDLPSYAKETSFKYGKAYYMSHTALWLTSIYSIGWSRTGVEKAFPSRGILGAPALIDSGSSLIVLQPDIYEFLMAELRWRLGSCKTIEEQSIVMCDCPPAHDLNGIPDLVINVVDDQNHAFPLCMAPDEYILQSIDPLSGRSTCVPALQKGTDRQPVPLIFGMTFMRSFYTNFDVENHRIGFARSNLSPMGPGATCSVHSQPFLSEAIWIASVVVALFSVGFACYVFILPETCCGKPLAEICCCCTVCAFGQDNKTAPSDVAPLLDGVPTGTGSMVSKNPSNSTVNSGATP